MKKIILLSILSILSLYGYSKEYQHQMKPGDIYTCKLNDYLLSQAFTQNGYPKDESLSNAIEWTVDYCSSSFVIDYTSDPKTVIIRMVTAPPINEIAGCGITAHVYVNGKSIYTESFSAASNTTGKWFIGPDGAIYRSIDDYLNSIYSY